MARNKYESVQLQLPIIIGKEMFFKDNAIVLEERIPNAGAE